MDLASGPIYICGQSHGDIDCIECFKIREKELEGALGQFEKMVKERDQLLYQLRKYGQQLASDFREVQQDHPGYGLKNFTDVVKNVETLIGY